MDQEIIDPNCIVKAFDNHNITIIKEEPNKYLFRGSDIATVLGITNIRSSIQNFTDKEKGVREIDTPGGKQKVLFLTSQGIYRLLYNSKKKIAEQFREWVGDILDDIIFNQSKEVAKQLKASEERQKLLEFQVETHQNYTQEERERAREQAIIEQFPVNTQCVYTCVISNKSQSNEDLIKAGSTNHLQQRMQEHRKTYGNCVLINAFAVSNKLEIENMIKKHPLLKERFRRITVDRQSKGMAMVCTELIAYNEQFTVNDIETVIKSIIRDREAELRNNLFTELDIEKERTKQSIEKTRQLQLQLQIENAKVVNKKLAEKLAVYIEYINVKTEYSPNPNDRILTADIYNHFCEWVTNNKHGFSIPNKQEFSYTVRDYLNYKKTTVNGKPGTIIITNRILR